MEEALSRRRYLLAAGSLVTLAGCGADAPAGETTTGDATATPDWSTGPSAARRPDPTVTVSASGHGEYDRLDQAIESVAPGTVIGVDGGEYSLTTVSRSTDGEHAVDYDTVETPGITLLGSGRAETVVDVDTGTDLLVLPSWQLWHLTITAEGSVLGPRADTIRDCYVLPELMDPVDYGRRRYQVSGDERSFTTSGLARSPGAQRTYYGISFDRVLDAVEDLGMDPTGSEPIDDAFASAYQSGTLIEFPPGEYLLADEHAGSGVSRFGIRGTGGDRRAVRLTPTRGARLKWLKPVGAGPHLVENLSFDERSDDTTQLSLWFRTTDGSVLKNVEWLGRTPDDSGFDYSLTAEVTDVDGVFTIDGLYAGLDEPAMVVDYPAGVAFLRAGLAHKGEIRLRNPVIHERNSSAVRSTVPTGVLTIAGGEFVNNQNANIRFGAGDHPSKVSSATGTYVKVDGSRNSADAVRLGADSDGYAGAVLRGLHIDWTKDSGRGVIAAPSWAGHGRAEFHDCVVRNEGDLFTVFGEPTTISESALVFENCAFTGGGGDFLAQGRPGSVLRDCCLDMPRAAIRGFATEDLSTGGCRRPARPTAPTPVITAHKRDRSSVVFSARDSTAPAGTISRYRWHLDGTTDTGARLAYTFPAAGTYTVSLTVTDDAGRSASTRRELLVDYPRLLP